MRIEGLSALVTGGGRGLGAALGRALCRARARVALVARSEDELRRTVEGIRAAGGEAHALPWDLGRECAIHALSGAAAALVGPIDLVVHCASELGPTPLRPLHDTDCEDLERVLAVNVVGPFRLTKALLGSMLLRGSGAIVQVSSDAAVVPYAGWGAYGASKAALDQLGRVWGAELEGTGVRVVSVDPGEMDTAMHAAAMPEADRSALASPEAVAERLLDVVRTIEQAPNGARLTLDQIPARAAATSPVSA
ncbi:MAG: SDR family NAD(P)-dependent oxidoreductase [Vicinamibacteria bacterium]